MSEQEQDRHLADLLLDERRTRKSIACQASRLRQLREALDAVKEPLEVEDFNPHIQQVDRMHPAAMLSELADSVKHLQVVQAEIESIESP